MAQKSLFSGVLLLLLHYLIAVFFPHLQPDEPLGIECSLHGHGHAVQD